MVEHILIGGAFILALVALGLSGLAVMLSMDNRQRFEEIETGTGTERAIPAEAVEAWRSKVL